jgi:hypothetical protein
MASLRNNETLLLLTLTSCLVRTQQPEGDASTSTTDAASATSVDTTSVSSAESDDPSIPGSATSPNPSGAESSNDTSSTSSGESSGESSDDTGGDDGSTGGSGHPNGTPCTSDDDCASGHCYIVLAPDGLCGECETDEDCEDITGFGCNPPDFASPDFAPATCGDGGLGSGCESSAACVEGLTCEVVLSLLVLDFTHCSACATHGDCGGDDLCSVTIDISTISGHWSCIPPASVGIGGTCDVDGDGDLACASGNCAQASIDNLGFLGICSECDADDDCADGFHCQAADVDTAEVMLIPATCVPD